MKLTVKKLIDKKKREIPISVLTVYDYTFAKVFNETDIDILLVGDSVGTNALGYDSIFDVTMRDMMHHSSAVVRGASDKFIMSDLPYGSYGNIRDAQNNASRLIGTGIDAVKIESERSAISKIEHVVSNGIAVCGHVGYTPQTPGLKTAVQGKDFARAEEIINLAIDCEKAGAFMLVLELIPRNLAEIITKLVKIPTIGIGAGNLCDGQVQVLPDILGLSDKIFRHTQVFGDSKTLIKSAVGSYVDAVRRNSFPTKKQSSELTGELIEKIKKSRNII